ncbi:hypothetical protein AB0D99_16820 [Streptomyces sp. NPDC047971]|uniref:hypothetical protein n=1 Tax=Streptomyces sp. NPDC047971 TaxID=3154499 RepID=UPI0033F9535A
MTDRHRLVLAAGVRASGGAAEPRAAVCDLVRRPFLPVHHDAAQISSRTPQEYA